MGGRTKHGNGRRKRKKYSNENSQYRESRESGLGERSEAI